MKPSFLLVLFSVSFTLINAQTSNNNSKKNSFSDPNSFPQLVNADIPGTPKLGKPVLLMAETNPVMGEGLGWAAPAVFDWNGDGKKDLLIGEFGSGMENGNAVGNFVRVYLNVGEDKAPKFSDEFEYASSTSLDAQSKGTGTPLSVFTWCCMAFRPQFVDLNADGYQDMITGQYNPGEVTWFKGSKRGFLPGEKLNQAGNSPELKKGGARAKLSVTDIDGLYYWNYSSVSFGDFDEDGDFDMIVGGAALRISKNIGTKTNPEFGIRELLMDKNNKPLKIYDLLEKEIAENPQDTLFLSGTYDCVPVVVDWDQDGVLDLLVTNGYHKKGFSAINFFRGLKTKEGYRFEKSVPLFSTNNGGKAFPGSWLRAYVTDWNNDGVNDLLIGTSIATLDGKFDHYLSWAWEDETRILKKNPGLYSKSRHQQYEKNIAKYEQLEKESNKKGKIKPHETKAYWIESYYGKGNYRNLVHKGYVYLMLGEKRN